MPTFNNRLIAYLRSNGIVYHQGGEEGDLINEANQTIDKTDAQLIDSFRDDVRISDRYMLAIFVALLATFALVLVKMILDIHDTWAFLVCMVVIVILLGIMHKCWKDRYRAANMLRTLPELDKRERLKVIMALMNESGETTLNFNPVKVLLGLFKLKK